MIRARMENVLRSHDIFAGRRLLADLEHTVEEIVDEAWLSNEQGLELLPQLKDQGSFRQWAYKHGVRRRSWVSRTSDVLRAAALGDRRRRRDDG